ncbi:hypothetical protein [Halovenus salina]|uniref:Uncharacterized protein n=1 Tax=Halovenus salina TaxID=1510225 RepID=A0ABD5W2L7_9EURY
MTTQIQEPKDSRDNKTTVYAEHPYPTPKLIERCGTHGERLTPLSPDERATLTVERGGMTYELADPEDTAVAYCEECFAQKRQRSHTHRDKSDMELLVAEQSGDTGPGTATGFLRCLLRRRCRSGVGSSLSLLWRKLGQVNQESGKCICPDHGEMTVSVQRFDE